MASPQAKAVSSPSEDMEMLLDGHFVAQCVHVVAVLGLADHIGDGARSVGELAAATGSSPPQLQRLLRALASRGVFRETAEGRFQLTPLGRTLRSDAPDSMRDKAIFETSPPLWAAVGGLLETVRDGEPAFPRLYDKPIFEFLAGDAELGATFNRYMTAQSNLHNAAIVEAYDFQPVRTLIDVGGGHGATLAAVLSRYPAMRGILFDLPEVATGALFEELNMADRCEARGGNMLHEVPAGGDAYIIKRVMMDETDDDAVAILRNCRSSMNRDGKVLIIDPMLPEPNRPHHNWLVDVLMMILTYGRCRTEEQYRALFDAAGFEAPCAIPTNSPNTILEAVPR